MNKSIFRSILRLSETPPGTSVTRRKNNQQLRLSSARNDVTMSKSKGRLIKNEMITTGENVVVNASPFPPWIREIVINEEREYKS